MQQAGGETVGGARPDQASADIALDGAAADFVDGLACVNACMRIVLTAAPQWWVLENPVGLLGRWLGRLGAALVFLPRLFVGWRHQG